MVRKENMHYFLLWNIDIVIGTWFVFYGFTYEFSINFLKPSCLETNSQKFYKAGLEKDNKLYIC